MGIFKKIIDLLTKKNHMTKKEEDELFFGKKKYERILDKHFELNSKIKENYKKRKNEKNYRKAINACKKQIEIADDVMQAFKQKYKDDLKKTYIFYKDEYTFEEYIKKEKKDHPFDPVSHRGYKQLAIIKHKNGEYEEVIKLCKKAKNQGWRGDWDKRIKRAEKKLNS